MRIAAPIPADGLPAASGAPPLASFSIAASKCRPVPRQDSSVSPFTRHCPHAFGDQPVRQTEISASACWVSSLWIPSGRSRFFRFAGMPLQNYPEIFACLGLVIGLYGILDLEVARTPERGCLIAAVGRLGKVLGPIGWLNLFWSGQWPIATLILCVTNDLVWWLPFAIYLRDSWPHFRATL